MPWGGDNQMPFNILELIEADETLSTCQIFNAEVCYGSGLVYKYDNCSSQTQQAIDDFFLDNDIPSYFLGVSQYFKHFGFAVSVIILNHDGTKIVRMLRKETCYCRFAPANREGRIEKIHYANWRNAISDRKQIETIELLAPNAPFADLAQRIKNNTKTSKFAIVSRVPTPDSTYYPIPYYASLFKGKWYNIKQLIGMAKEAKLKNSAPIKYQIEISNKYWESIFKAEGITDRRKQQERIIKEKTQILDFLTGAENAGKVWFSTFYVNPNGELQHGVVITKIDEDTEGATGQRTYKKLSICFALLCVFTQTSWVLCRANRNLTTAARTNVSFTRSPKPCKNPITTSCLPCIA